MTTAEIMSLIAKLQQQIADLQKQLALNAGEKAWWGDWGAMIGSLKQSSAKGETNLVVPKEKAVQAPLASEYWWCGFIGTVTTFLDSDGPGGPNSFMPYSPGTKVDITPGGSQTLRVELRTGADIPPQQWNVTVQAERGEPINPDLG